MTEFNLFAAVYIFFAGACVGSFLNVCIYRIPENISVVKPRSSCPECNTAIPFYLNIPIFGYLLLKGRCRFCSATISFRYPAVELLTAAFALILYVQFSFTPVMVFWFAFISTLITISFIDFDHRIIPDLISLPGIVIFSSSFIILPDMTIRQTGLGILAGGGSLYMVALIYYLIKKEEGMGGGDIKLLAMIGAATGVKGVIFTIFTGSLLGTVGGIAMMVSQKMVNSKLKIPFGPFLSMGAIIYIFFGDRLITWYLSALMH